MEAANPDFSAQDLVTYDDASCGVYPTEINDKLQGPTDGVSTNVRLFLSSDDDVMIRGRKDGPRVAGDAEVKAGSCLERRRLSWLTRANIEQDAASTYIGKGRKDLRDKFRAKFPGNLDG